MAHEKKTDRAEMLRKARERTQAELLKKAVDMSTGSKGAALTALAVAILIPSVDAAGLTDLLDNAIDVPGLDALQASPRKRRY